MKTAALRVALACGLLATGVGVTGHAPPSLAVAGPLPGDGRSQVQVRLTPVEGTSVAQGVQYPVTATARNQGSQSQHVRILFDLRPESGQQEAVGFASWDATIPPQSAITTELRVASSQWFAEVGSFLITSSVGGQQAGTPLVFDVLAPLVTAPAFEDVTGPSGIRTYVGGPVCERFGSGAAWADVEGDGDLDLFVPRHERPAQLWINDGSGHFTDQATIRGVDNAGAPGVGATFADYDDDGDPDLYVLNDGPNRLFRNDGEGHFEDVAGEAGVADTGSGPSASWGDYDDDGHLDLYVTNYRTCGLPLQQDRLYHNEGDGTFVDHTDLLEREGTTYGAGFQATWFDYDSDGDLDLYLANDYLVEINENANRLWRNDGPDPDLGWRFTDVTDASGAGYRMNSMGVGLGDPDGDLDVDLAISNIGSTVLATNQGDGTFLDTAEGAGIARPLQDARTASVTWGLGFADLNLDGWEDLYVAAGAVHLPSGPQPNEVFVNDGTGTFYDLSALSGADQPSIDRGVAFADYDHDGRMDFFIVSESGQAHLLHNVTPRTGHWLEIDMVGVASNRDGCGALLRLSTASRTMIREIACGGTSLASGSDSVAHFGLGAAVLVDQLSITWPSGVEQVIEGIAVDQILTVTEPA